MTVPCRIAAAAALCVVVMPHFARDTTRTFLTTVCVCVCVVCVCILCVQSDLEEDDGIVKADTSPFPEQGRHLEGAASPTDQERGAAGALKIQAMEASAAGDYARALDLLTRVVKAGADPVLWRVVLPR